MKTIIRSATIIDPNSPFHNKTLIYYFYGRKYFHTMNTIAEHIADFLKQYPPFDNLTFEELSEIATSIRVVNIEKHKTLFQINDVLHDSFYVVASGVINLSVIADAEETLLNKCMV